MRYHEQLGIILMRDNGPRRSFRLRRSSFFALVIFFGCMPVVCAVLAWQCWQLWQENASLRANMQRFEMDCQMAQATAERLQNFEELLREEGVQGRELLLRRLARAGGDSAQAQEGATAESAQAAAASSPLGEGPGHEDFPEVDTGRVKVANVQARALRGNGLRIGLDLRNTETQKLLAGTVSATLVTASGQKCPLAFDPEDVGNFRISRFKRAVMVARVPDQYSLVNAQVILEVTEPDSGLIYRNIFAVER
ncbi:MULTISPECIES: hypothetical protein [unclassified Desulfovibrio]|uniref:hypothetical protein n=1 Tax=unclassified Desulfovibrio TaxID=2593640 RepID=UPI0013E9B090|nr:MULTISPECIES: hypothetical protein [unclassified Desulfovibrio]